MTVTHDYSLWFRSLDHTTNSAQGHYIYIEASFPAKANDTARIISEQLVVGQGCFSLWYHMYGFDIGSLVIYTSTPANPRTEVQRISGNQGDIWKSLTVDLAVVLQATESVRIIVEGVVGESHEGTRILRDTSRAMVHFLLSLLRRWYRRWRRRLVTERDVCNRQSHNNQHTRRSHHVS